MEDKILKIENLTVTAEDYFGKKTDLIHDVSTSFSRKKITGIVGESGSGKSMLMKTILDLLPDNVSMAYKSINFDGQDIASIKDLSASIIFQDPMTSLNPLRTIGYHLKEVIDRYYDLDKEGAKKLMVEQLNKVRINNPLKVLGSYPHELSGGMIQRIMISLALLKKPKLLVADEPTTALDVTIQAQILEIIRDLNAKEDLTVIFVSHDLGVIRDLCHEVKVMYDGKILEEAPSKDLFTYPRHKYTQELLKAIPTGKNKERLYEMDKFYLSEEEKFGGQMVEVSQGHYVLVGGNNGKTS